MKTKTITAVAVVIASAIGGYWYASPYLELSKMHDAAQVGDARAFNQRVDYPSVRESIKGQITSLITKEMGASADGMQALGAILGLAIVNQMVEALVQPEVVMAAMQKGEVDLTTQVKGGRNNTTDASSKDNVEWLLKRDGFNRVIAYQKDLGADETSLVFDRQGFASWRLTEIRMGDL